MDKYIDCLNYNEWQRTLCTDKIIIIVFSGKNLKIIFSLFPFIRYDVIINKHKIFAIRV